MYSKEKNIGFPNGPVFRYGNFFLKITAHSEIVFLYELTKQKIREIVDALVKRNQISTWPMWKSDFRMGHVEI